jgi:hypothetical protein
MARLYVHTDFIRGRDRGTALRRRRSKQMRKGLFLVAALALAPAATAAARPTLPLSGFLRVATALTGLHAPAGVRVDAVSAPMLRARAVRSLDARYPRGLQAYHEQIYRALGLLGPAEPLRPALLHAFADPAQLVVDGPHRRVSVPAGAAAGGRAVQGLVRLLQDRAFGLTARTPAASQSSDAAIAAFAASDGTAALAARKLRSSQVTPAPPGSRAAAFLALEAAFPEAVGTRLAANLYDIGGNDAVQSVLRRRPVSSEQVFHLDKYLARERPVPIALPPGAAGFSLVRHDSFGELDVRALLAVFTVARLDRVGAGWGGGRSALYRDATGGEAVVLRLDWDTETDAREWQDAVARYVNQAFDAGTPSPCQADTCWAPGQRSIAFVRKATHSALVLGPTVTLAAELAHALVP